MDLKENADIRRALDNLQQMVEVLNDRYREVRRERKLLRERVDELIREREVAEANLAAHVDRTVAERERTAELEQRLRAGAQEREQFAAETDELRRAVADRDGQLKELERLRDEVVALRQGIVHEREERASLEEKHLQAIGKLDAATRAEAMARTDTASRDAVVATREQELAAAHARIEDLEAELRLRTAEAGQGAEGAEQLVARERELKELNAKLQDLERAHAEALATMHGRLAEAELEQARLERLVVEMSAERDAARADAAAAGEQLSLVGATDDERTNAANARVAELSKDLSAALKREAAASKEAEMLAQDLIAAEAHVVRLEAAVEELKNAAPAKNGLYLADDERAKLGEQIDSAISLIDKHLAAGGQ